MLDLAGLIFDDAQATGTDRGDILDGLRRVRCLRSWLDRCDGLLRQRLDTVSASATDAADDAREASRCSRSQSRRRDRRSRIMTVFPDAVEALSSGLITAEHLDVLVHGWFSLEADRRDELKRRGPRLVGQAGTMSPEAFGVEMRHVVDQLRADAGESRGRRQRRATRLRTWTDRSTGMVRLNGSFDPALARSLMANLHKALNARHAMPIPDDCPMDPIAKNDWLRAHALIDLIEGGSGRTRTDIVVVVDRGQVRSTVGEMSLGEVIELLQGGKARHVSLTVGDNGAIDHDGSLDLGRHSRLPNHGQRRALFALYPTCAIPGCSVEFSTCTIHHVRWWRHGGATNLDNLLPLCGAHHRAVHQEGWQLTLLPNRHLVVVRADGTRLESAPPRGPTDAVKTRDVGPGSPDPPARRHTVDHDTSRRTVDDADLLGALDGQGLERALPHQPGQGSDGLVDRVRPPDTDRLRP